MRLLVCNNHTGKTMAAEVSQHESVNELLRKALVPVEKTSDYVVLYEKQILLPTFTLNWYGIKDGSKLVISKKAKSSTNNHKSIELLHQKSNESRWEEYDMEKCRITDLAYLKTEVDTYYLHIFRYLKSYVKDLEKSEIILPYGTQTVIPDQPTTISTEPLPELF